MGKVVFVEPDPFLGSRKKANDFVPDYYAANQAAYTTEEGAQKVLDQYSVSRPLTGIVPKPNTHAIVQIKTADGKTVKVFNRLGAETENGVTVKTSASSDPASNVWTDWLLQSVHEERAEKTQIVETFGDTFLYAFGQRPRVLSFSGILFNTADYNWRAIFWENWDRFFRASQLIRMNARMYIYYDEVLVEGYPMNAAADQVAADNQVMSFNFNFFVTNYVNLVAQAGFQSVRSNVASIVRAGYSQSEYEDFEIKTNTGRLTDLLPVIGKFPKEGFLGGFVGDSANRTALAVNMLIGNTSPNALTAIAVNSAVYEMERWRNDTVKEQEDKFGLVRGETNQWFGFLSSIIESRAPTIVTNPLSTAIGEGQVNSAQLVKAVQLGMDPSNALGEGANAYGIFVTGG